jgi:hypothetical protein
MHMFARSSQACASVGSLKATLGRAWSPLSPPASATSARAGVAALEVVAEAPERGGVRGSQRGLGGASAAFDIGLRRTCVESMLVGGFFRRSGWKSAALSIRHTWPALCDAPIAGPRRHLARRVLGWAAWERWHIAWHSLS